MTAAQVLRTLKSVPFQRFAMHLADGREIVVTHPEAILLTGGGRIAQYWSDEGPPEVIDVLMIVSLRPIK